MYAAERIAVAALAEARLHKFFFKFRGHKRIVIRRRLGKSAAEAEYLLTLDLGINIYGFRLVFVLGFGKFPTVFQILHCLLLVFISAPPL